MEQTKTCYKCKEEKPLDNFYRMPTKKDGRHSYCKKCHNAKAKIKKEDPYRFF